MTFISLSSSAQGPFGGAVGLVWETIGSRVGSIRKTFTAPVEKKSRLATATVVNSSAVKGQASADSLKVHFITPWGIGGNQLVGHDCLAFLLLFIPYSTLMDRGGRGCT